MASRRAAAGRGVGLTQVDVYPRLAFGIYTRQVPKPLHTRLWVVVAAALAPTAVLAGVALVLLHQGQKSDMARATIETMRAMVSAVDGELKNTVSLTEALAASTALDSGELATFHEHARRVTESNPDWVTVVLTDETGQQLLNVPNPLDATLSGYADQRSFQQVVATGKPAIGSLSGFDAKGTPGYSVRAPVVRDGRVRYVLTAVIAPEAMLRVINRQKVPPNGVVSIFDARGNHVARSRSHARFLGRPPSATLRKLMKDRSEGWGSSVTLEGQEIYAAFSRSADSGWSVAVGMPASEIDASAMRSFGTLGLGLLLSLAAGALASLIMAQLVTKPISELRRAAQAVGRGEVPNVKPMRIAEINDVSRALTGAARARKQAEQSREELLERERDARAAAEAASRSKDEFLAMLGHELRNPLSAIGTAAHVLQAQRSADKLPEGVVSAQRVILRQVDHLARLVDDLLDVARVVSGKVILRPEIVDVADVVDNSVATLRASGRFEHHAVEVATVPAWVKVDPTRLQQVISNLLVNAVKYTPRGGRIEISVASDADEVKIQVRDDGVGISAELLPRVFDLFEQGKQELDRSQGGLGIGLTLVRKLVELHGGSVRADSAGEGQGSVFTVRLPAVRSPAVRESMASVPYGAPCHVVVVEDNADSREMLRTLLELQGHRVEVASDGPQGFERVMQERPQVALIDLGLPGYSGFELARRIRHRARDEIRLVALSGYGSEQDKARSRDAGFDLHLVKPISSNDLGRVLATTGQSRDLVGAAVDTYND